MPGSLEKRWSDDSSAPQTPIWQYSAEDGVFVGPLVVAESYAITCVRLPMLILSVPPIILRVLCFSDVMAPFLIRTISRGEHQVRARGFRCGQISSQAFGIRSRHQIRGGKYDLRNHGPLEPMASRRPLGKFVSN